MRKPERQLDAPREARDRARAEFNRRLALAKIDLAPGELKRRVVAEAQRTTMSVAHQAIDIANDSRGLAAATVAALTLWLARKPIMAKTAPLLQKMGLRRTTPKTAGNRFKSLIDGAWRRLKDYADE